MNKIKLMNKIAPVGIGQFDPNGYAISADMDAAKEGDFNAGVSTMQVATRDMDDTLVLVCYSGKRYAQATTNVLSALGYDMSKVYTLEGGFTKWSETYPDQIEK